MKSSVLGALLIFVMSSLMSGCYNPAERELRLVQNAVVSRAVVAISDCDKLIGVKYDFVVAEVKYRGSAPWPEFSCHNTRVGQEIAVFYDPESPSFNSVEDPSVLYQRNKGWYLPVWLAVPLIFVAIVAAISVITLAQGELDTSKTKRAPPR